MPTRLAPLFLYDVNEFMAQKKWKDWSQTRIEAGSKTDVTIDRECQRPERSIGRQALLRAMEAHMHEAHAETFLHYRPQLRVQHRTLIGCRRTHHRDRNPHRFFTSESKV